MDTYAQMHTRLKLLGEDADVDHTQTIGGDTAKLLGGYIHLISTGFRHPCLNALFWNRNASDVTMKYLLRANTTSHKDIRVSVFNRMLGETVGTEFSYGNIILSAKFFAL